jgi:DNA-binding CsgD family transcriptional regulator
MDDVRLETVLEHVNVPSYHIDTSGVVRWLNAAARNLVGDVRGAQFTSVVAPEDTRLRPGLGPRRGAARARRAPPHPATGRVLALLERGRTTRQIADELHLSVETVRNHIRRLLKNLGVHSRLEAVAVAHEAA